MPYLMRDNRVTPDSVELPSRQLLPGKLRKLSCMSLAVPALQIEGTLGSLQPDFRLMTESFCLEDSCFSWDVTADQSKPNQLTTGANNHHLTTVLLPLQMARMFRPLTELPDKSCQS